MAKKKHSRDHWWGIARKKYHLTPEQIKMAKEIGMNPRKFSRYAPNKSEPWKGPLGSFIERCHDKRFNKA